MPEERTAANVPSAQILHRNQLMLKAYLDASGTDPNQPIIVVGGWVASEDRWAEFKPQWDAFVVDCFGPNGGRWHHTDFNSGYGLYEGWAIRSAIALAGTFAGSSGRSTRSVSGLRYASVITVSYGRSANGNRVTAGAPIPIRCVWTSVLRC